MSDYSRPQRPRSFWSAPGIDPWRRPEGSRALGTRMVPDPIFLACAESSFSIISQSDLNINDRKSINRGLPHQTWRQSAFLVLTKRKAGSQDELGDRLTIEMSALLMLKKPEMSCNIEPVSSFPSISGCESSDSGKPTNTGVPIELPMPLATIVAKNGDKLAHSCFPSCYFYPTY